MNTDPDLDSVADNITLLISNDIEIFYSQSHSIFIQQFTIHNKVTFNVSRNRKTQVTVASFRAIRTKLSRGEDICTETTVERCVTKPLIIVHLKALSGLSY